jgi:hypothetical protein
MNVILHDGTPDHFLFTVTQQLSQQLNHASDEQWIGLASPVNLHALSSDIIPVNFWLFQS